MASQRCWILKAPSILQLLSLNLSLQVHCPTKWDFQFLWHLWSLDVISASQTVSLPHSTRSLLSASFISFHVPPAHHSQAFTATVSPGRYSLHWPWQSITLNHPNYLFFFFSYLWFTRCCWRKALNHAATHLLQFIFPVLLSSQYCPGILLQTFGWFDFPFLLQNYSSIKPLLFSLNPHFNAVLLKTPPPSPSKSHLYFLS